MLERLGIVTNCWKTVLESGERFEDLVNRFCCHGFKEIEIRDGDYLRSSSIGKFLTDVEKMAAHYDCRRWREFCNRIHRGQDWGELVGSDDKNLSIEIDRFANQTSDAVFSYAISYPWLSSPPDLKDDNHRILTAIKVAYLLNPDQPRLRFVSIESIEHINVQAAVDNLKRYGAIAPECPVALNVENARHPAQVMLELARAGGMTLAYDEANNYRLDGPPYNTPEEFWQVVRVEDLASIHLKQKNEHGLLGSVGDGFVDLHAVVDRLRDMGYTGDLLFENAATADPLADAIASRAYIT